MLRITIILTAFLLVLSFGTQAAETAHLKTQNTDTSLLERLIELKLAADFEPTKTPTGVDFVSKAMMTLQNGQKTPETMMIMEGALPAPDGITTIEDAVNYNISLIINTTKLNPDYPEENVVEKGMGAQIIDVNGTKVGILEFQTPDMHMAKMTRAILIKDAKLYSFQLVSFKTDLHKERELNLWAFIIAAVNSGEL